MKGTDELQTAWKALPRFPWPRDDDDLDDLAGDVDLLDTQVAAFVSAVVGVVPLEGASTFRPEPELRDRIAARVGDRDPTVAADARALLEYLDQLHAVIELAHRTRAATRPKRERR